MDDTDIPSAFGFRVFKPRTRHERAVAKDKVALEQQRINARVGHSARMHQANAPATSAGLTTCQEGGAGYLSNANRFHSDTCGEELEVRNEVLRKKQAALEFRKNQAEMREQSRWNSQERMAQREDEYWANAREVGEGCRKNQSLVAYDITSLDYKPTHEGQIAAYEDDMIRYREKLRTRNLVIKGDTRSAYNIITGGAINLPPEPAIVPKPVANKR